MSTKPYRMLILHVPAKLYRMLIYTLKALGNANSESRARKRYSLSIPVFNTAFCSEQQNITERLDESSDLSSRRGQMPGGTRERATYGLLRPEVGEW